LNVAEVRRMNRLSSMPRKLERGADGREGAFADADDSDLRRFEQGDVERPLIGQVEELGEIGRVSHPPYRRRRSKCSASPSPGL